VLSVGGNQVGLSWTFEMELSLSVQSFRHPCCAGEVQIADYQDISGWFTARIALWRRLRTRFLVFCVVACGAIYGCFWTVMAEWALFMHSGMSENHVGWKLERHYEIWADGLDGNSEVHLHLISRLQLIGHLLAIDRGPDRFNAFSATQNI